MNSPEIVRGDSWHFTDNFNESFEQDFFRIDSVRLQAAELVVFV